MSDVYRHRYAERSSAPTLKIGRLGSGVIFPEQGEVFPSPQITAVTTPNLLALDEKVLELLW